MSEQAKVKLKGRIVVKDGKCPNGHSLMSGDHLFEGQKSVKIKIKLAGKICTLFLDPFYDNFDYKCDMGLSEGQIVEAFCPECDTSLTIDTICSLCNIQMFAIHLPDGGEVEVCPKVGCRNHALKIVDLDEQLSRMYVDETKFQM